MLAPTGIVPRYTTNKLRVFMFDYFESGKVKPNKTNSVQLQLQVKSKAEKKDDDDDMCRYYW